MVLEIPEDMDLQITDILFFNEAYLSKTKAMDKPEKNSFEEFDDMVHNMEADQDLGSQSTNSNQSFPVTPRPEEHDKPQTLEELFSCSNALRGYHEEELWFLEDLPLSGCRSVEEADPMSSYGFLFPEFAFEPPLVKQIHQPFGPEQGMQHGDYSEGGLVDDQIFDLFGSLRSIPPPMNDQARGDAPRE